MRETSTERDSRPSTEEPPATSRSRVERLLLVLTPAVAMTAVAVGLRLGARDEMRAALVYGAPPASRTAALAWQVSSSTSTRVRASPRPLWTSTCSGTVRARPCAGTARRTAMGSRRRVSSWRRGIRPTRSRGRKRRKRRQRQRARSAADPRGAVRGRVARTRGRRAAAARPSGCHRCARGRETGWLAFARREGPIALDVAALGQRVAPGFPAELWVRARDAPTRRPLAGVAIAHRERHEPRAGSGGDGHAPTRGAGYGWSRRRWASR